MKRYIKILPLLLALVLLTSLALPRPGGGNRVGHPADEDHRNGGNFQEQREVCLPAEKHAALQRLPCGDL